MPISERGGSIRMRLWRIVTHVCQHCIFANNDKGKWDRKEKHWLIYCKKKEKYYKWDKYKFCFKPNESTKNYDKAVREKYITRSGKMIDEIICPNCGEMMDWAGEDTYHCGNCNTDIYEDD